MPPLEDDIRDLTDALTALEIQITTRQHTMKDSKALTAHQQAQAQKAQSHIDEAAHELARVIADLKVLLEKDML